ncbi:MAG: hypothetical protein JWM02_2729 [Frankiales bacterium]|nr:hypothetical protein [Frankiales bacterium]
MRRAVATVMSGLSVLVVGTSLRGSSHSHTAALSGAPAGVVQPVAPTTSSQTPSAPTPTASAAPTPRAAPRSVTVNGSPADTQFGPVQVQITLTNGRLVRADAIVYPQGSGRDQEINSYAIPQLDQETLQRQSAQIDTVSGATYTSDGYKQSLQSALDAARKG